MTEGVDQNWSVQDPEVERRLDFVAQFMGLLGDKLYLLPDEDKRQLLEKLETLFRGRQGQGTEAIDDTAILALFQEQRRHAFVEQVRRVLVPYFKGMSPRQMDLLDAGVSELYRQNRLVSDDELLGQLELVTRFVSPLGQEQIQKVYWDLRLEGAEAEGSKRKESGG